MLIYEMKKCILIIVLIWPFHLCFAQIKILFDASKAETAGNADWIIDADSYNIFWPSAGGYRFCTAGPNCGDGNAQNIPTPFQNTITAATTENFWSGGLSYWGIDCVRQGYAVETLPYNGVISFGNAANPFDLSNYKVFVVCEPNIIFTAAEKTAIMNFINAGGSLFMISGHDISDRNNDGIDSPRIWNDLIQNNGSGNSNPFGFIFDYVNISINPPSTSVASLPSNDSLLRGPFGNATRLKWSGGTTMTLTPSANPTLKAVFYSRSPASGNSNVMVAYGRYGNGRVVAFGDSSPFDDGTGDINDILFNGYTGDAPPDHRNLIMNSTIWLASFNASCDVNNWTGVISSSWENPYNWSCGTIPGANTEVRINAGKPNYPIISSNAICKSMYNNSGTSIRVKTGFKLNVLGS